MTSGQAAPTTLQGEVTEVLFRKEDSGWGILKVREALSGEDRVVTGVIGNLAAGNFLEARGQWVQGRRGKEFKASFIRNNLPSHPDGIIKFLASGAFIGIGRGIAERLVGAFGSETLNILMESPDRVAKVHGVGLRRARALQDALLPMRMEAPVLSDLNQVMGPAMAQKAVQVFGGQAASMIKDNPYGFTGSIPGFGFKRADSVALANGMKPDSPERLSAAALWVLRDAESSGHCALPLDLLESKVSELTGVDRQAVARERLNAVLSGETTSVEAEDGLYVMRRAMAEMEEAVATALLRRLASPLDASDLGAIDQRISRFARARGVPLDWRQRTGVSLALTSRISVITGFPGTGKSAALAVLVDLIGHDRVTLAAPTGAAAERMRLATGLTASTLHSLLGYKPTGEFTYGEDNRLPVKFLILDEGSMVDLPLLHAVLMALPDDAQLLIVGDVDQLPSVGPGNVLADLITSGVLPVTRFETVYRQGAGSEIIHNALLIRRGQAPDFSGMSREYRFYEAPTAEDAARVALEQLRTVFPKSGYDLRTDVQALSVMNKGLIGVDAMNDAVQAFAPGMGKAKLQTPTHLLQVGSKVIQTKNDYILNVFNGAIGHVVEIDERKSIVTVRFGDRRIEYTADRLRNLRLGWAISTHRSQGSEYPGEVFPVAAYNRHMLDRQILFTALTRAKSELAVIGPSKLIAEAATRPPRVRHTLLRWRLQTGARRALAAR
ncbi:hypothetical protein E4T66_17845 [Sinimarinibacterium sp. CAU 1509]|uniref:SF1B family DNA helicase RecD2 n=1 Tax=Sinimarinibacterium sp. CAU 1509 TaxID=2562283 RepID=UPI0010AB4FC9|nr:AAA family ATPase [Sinimarinibacterium sp. CAU 1509]TJY57270.1 hypothetical protein E4T66_17845 [Sinimarinibacterium sp. CAU 1509]